MEVASVSKKVIIYLLRRDLRLSDNPIFHELSRLYSSPTSPFTHILPLYVFPYHQIEISGFIPEAQEAAATPKSPYPEARSQIGGFWRCGPHRAKFLAESVWDLKRSLEKAGSGMIVRTGKLADIVRHAIDHLDRLSKDKAESRSSAQAPREDLSETKVEVVGVWMTADESTEERHEQQEVQKVAEERGKQFRIFQDEKYYVDDRDLHFDSITDLSDVFTSFRKSLEPLRERPRRPLPRPSKLPPMPEEAVIPPQLAPFQIPETLDGLITALLKPLEQIQDLQQPPSWPKPVGSSSEEKPSAHPFQGGESRALARVDYLLATGAMSAYKDTRNGLIGPDFSTKISGYLANGSLTARQVHAEMVLFEDGQPAPVSSSESESLEEEVKAKLERWKSADGFGQGENKGTAGVRFELLWRDYFRLVARKYGSKLYHLQGLRGSPEKEWNHNRTLRSWGGSREEVAATRFIMQRFCSGRTGIGLIDASQREIYLTGYTSNRARQNVASFLAKHLNVDWRLGAEWYESMLVDYDAYSNWGNWQYVAGVGNDPREGRLFNPVKQALDYDKKGDYIKTWVSELRGLDIDTGKTGEIDEEKLMGLFQPWRLSESEKEQLNIQGVDWVEKPLVQIQFSVGKKPRPGGGRGRGYRGRGGPSRSSPSRGRGWRRSGQVDRANEAEQSR